jgi:catechol 2,3-dioxygenase-like lactoylglutathione lyase family enzyme
MATKSKTGVKVPAKKAASTPAAPAVPHLFRVTLEVNHLERAKTFYEELLAMKARKLPGLRLHFDCGGCVLEITDVSASGPSHPNAKSVSLSVPNLEAVHKRARKLKCLSIELVPDKAGGAMHKRPWGEKSFYVDDPWFNSLCFVQAGTEYRG